MQGNGTSRVQFSLPPGVRFNGDPDKFLVPYTVTPRSQ